MGTQSFDDERIARFGLRANFTGKNGRTSGGILAREIRDITESGGRDGTGNRFPETAFEQLACEIAGAGWDWKLSTAQAYLLLLGWVRRNVPEKKKSKTKAGMKSGSFDDFFAEVGQRRESRAERGL